MKKRHTAQLRHRVASTRRISVSAFFNLRALLAAVVCATAASFMITGTLLAFFDPEAPAKASHPAGTGLTFAERVAYQRAIEDVYWRHRIWPKERTDHKPSLEAVMSQAQIESRVQDYLRKSQALEDYWQRPITTEQLQAEMDRMAKHTKQPDVLRELFQALGNDPFAIAECLARPVLIERLPAHLSFEQVKETSRTFSQIETGTASYALPTISDPTGGCTDDTWTATSLVSATNAASHTAVWTGSEMIVWGGFECSPHCSYLNTGGRYNPSTDSWTATSTTNAPRPRYGHTAVWTGTEMIVWGGIDSPDVLNTGGRYNPSTDRWTGTSTTGAPTERRYHTAVWTGSEMIVWGGLDANLNNVNTGGRYNPDTDSWTATSTVNAPSRRESHTAVWTGNEMIVWGGGDYNGYTFAGGRYNPSADTWMATSTTNAPDGRGGHTAVWTGSEMIVWGGDYLNTGAKYNPSTASWTATSTTNAPSIRLYHTAVWTGSEMIVWGGEYCNPNCIYLNTGARYNPDTDGWVATSTINAPPGRAYHTAVWTGSKMIAWGGLFQDGGGFHSLNSGGKYCAQSGPTPTPTATPTATATATPTATPTSTPRPSPTPRPALTPRPRPTPAPRP
jgi:N-acetylneuraminic acid mutarotase